uniref:Uncharacterized protein n=1 Tax=viral metagenome TaxID=1070528 RepID=A0A6C0B893_9ZZZZ
MIKYITIDGRLNADYLPFAQSFTEFPDKVGKINSFSIVSVELPVAFIDASNGLCCSPRYVYLEVTDNREHNCVHLFTSSIICSRNSKHIISRITLDYKNYPNGSILPANLFNGFLITGIRQYNKPIYLRDIYFRLLNELGDPIFFENECISFCIEVKCTD